MCRREHANLKVPARSCTWEGNLTNSTVSVELGSTVALRRKQLGVTQEELAALAGVSVRFLSSLERGKPTVRLDTLLAVLDALGLELRTPVRGTA